MNRVLSAYDLSRRTQAGPRARRRCRRTDLIAYFCAEFGYHESLPVYSGGLGILAGDHCKSASDLRLPFVAVGLLYRQGYFSQRIDNDGNQIATYTDSEFDDLPMHPALNEDGKEICTSTSNCPAAPGGSEGVGSPRRPRAPVPARYRPARQQRRGPLHHAPALRRRPHTRIQQEIVLGIGGMRALEQLGIKPTAWHINEGHAAFLVLERIRRKVKGGLSFPPPWRPWRPTPCSPPTPPCRPATTISPRT
jgi:starch phosphorylase